MFQFYVLFLQTNVDLGVWQTWYNLCLLGGMEGFRGVCLFNLFIDVVVFTLLYLGCSLVILIKLVGFSVFGLCILLDVVFSLTPSVTACWLIVFGNVLDNLEPLVMCNVWKYVINECLVVIICCLRILVKF